MGELDPSKPGGGETITSFRESGLDLPPKTGEEAGIDSPFYAKWATALVALIRENTTGAIREWWSRIMVRAYSDGPEGLDAKTHKMIDQMEGTGPINDKLRAELRELVEIPFPFDVWSIYGSWLSLKVSRFRGWLAGIANIQLQEINTDLRPNVIDHATLARFAQIYPRAETAVNAWLDRLGIPEEQQLYLKGVMRQFPSVIETLTLLNRKVITTSQAYTILQTHGFTEADADKILELRFYYPSPTDWASLAGREAFEEDQIATFGLDSGFDKIDPATYERAGMTRETARWLWVAHWTNVSPQQFFEMIHRKARDGQGGTWTVDDIPAYVRLADINPTFGQGLEDISYNPYTRVDVRRMFQDGILEEADLKEAYMDLGYDDDKAKKMADWTKAYAERNQRSLTRTQIEQMFNLRQIDRIQLAIMLELIGYSEEQAESISLLAEGKREEKRLRSFIRRAEYEYKRQLKTSIEVSRTLIDEDIEPAQIGGLLQEWDNEAVYEQALPSKEDLFNWLAGPDFSQEQFRDGMRALRYTDENIDLYLQDQGARLSKTDILRLMDQEEIGEERSLQGLKDLGYDAADAMALIGPVVKRIDRRRKLEQAETGD